MAYWGFLDLAERIIRENPHGLTAKEVFLLAQARSAATGVPISGAINPESSLTCTLGKWYETRGLRRERGKRGVWVYYPR